MIKRVGVILFLPSKVLSLYLEEPIALLYNIFFGSLLSRRGHIIVRFLSANGYLAPESYII